MLEDVLDCMIYIFLLGTSSFYVVSACSIDGVQNEVVEIIEKKMLLTKSLDNFCQKLFPSFHLKRLRRLVFILNSVVNSEATGAFSIFNAQIMFLIFIWNCLIQLT